MTYGGKMPVFGVLEAFRTNAVRSMATLSVCPTGGMNVPTRSDDRAAAEGCGCRHGGWAMGQSQGRQECRPSQACFAARFGMEGTPLECPDPVG